jgi:hypothetical protein
LGWWQLEVINCLEDWKGMKVMEKSTLTCNKLSYSIWTLFCIFYSQPPKTSSLNSLE